MGDTIVRRAPGVSPWIAAAVAAVLWGQAPTAAAAQSPATETLTIRGRPQQLHLYGQRGGNPIIVSSSDGGWVRLGPHIAATLAAHGYFVVGFDSKAYLESFTSGSTTLRAEDVAGDYDAIVAFAGRNGSHRPILIGASEGAGLSVLAATDPRVQQAIGGVIGVGLPDLTELGWRWRDAVIYITHGVPNEPTFSTAAIIDRVAPVPLAVIHASRDEFVPLAEIERIVARAKEPKQLRVVEAADHRFSDALANFDSQLLDAISWAYQHGSR